MPQTMQKLVPFLSGITQQEPERQFLQERIPQLK